MELRDIQELMQVLKKENLTEMKIKYGNVKLTLTNSETGQVTNAAAPVTKKVQKNIAKALPKEEVIKSSNVGRIRLINSKVGTSVRKGEILARINTIGIDNDVKATVNGVLKEVLVADGSAVDFAKELFKIEVK
ncbi:acetyl-CoA carboxylase biotin carboxyl carrier protein [Leptotrichia buccalis]|jgi:biotin/lipoyl attachment domain-containing protein|uniref:Biotin/lipoyl attachment domain-containing protein n=1 Tax=Leptotrichia buccalis (strain ATCC 14201 / DSM 1135 / JCM 12969 / NCTC 10249 / C-1013-b) TaxID=523794 RepID=C7NCE8_LEPBD|nr:biotin/lipoyl-containing protein [Leptotrichia buccalis]ACV39794.1 biotin/lipoyl attachment domain-containing protein [Leptotrichia buccalis C-1013-b]